LNKSEVPRNNCHDRCFQINITSEQNELPKTEFAKRSDFEWRSDDDGFKAIQFAVLTR
jgi:hypothetical protein